MASRKPHVRLIVRRGAQRRYDALKEKTRDLPVDLAWDRRTGDHGATGHGGTPGAERRRRPPFTWELADFVVVTEPRDGLAAPDQQRDGGGTRRESKRAGNGSKRS